MANVTQLPTTRTASQGAAGVTLRRTKTGGEELVVEKRALSEAQRQTVLYANGKRDLAELQRLVPSLAESSAVIESLKQMGLIELVDLELGEVIANESQPSAHNESGAYAESSASTAPAARSPANSAPTRGSDLDETKNALRIEIPQLIGDESKRALERLEQIQTADELSRFVGKLVELVKLYAGKPAGERFAQRFKQWV